MTKSKRPGKHYLRSYIYIRMQAALFARVVFQTHTIKIMLMNAQRKFSCVRMRVCQLVCIFICVRCVFSRFAIVIRGVNGSAASELFRSVIYVGETPLAWISQTEHDKESLYGDGRQCWTKAASTDHCWGGKGKKETKTQMHACLISRLENSDRGCAFAISPRNQQRISFFYSISWLDNAKIQMAIWSLGIKIDSQKSRHFQPSFACKWILWLALSLFHEQSPSGHFALGQRKLLWLQTADKNESARWLRWRASAACVCSLN